VVQRASTDVEDGIEKLVEEAIKEGLEEMLGSRLAEAFYTTLNNFVKVLRGLPEPTNKARARDIVLEAELQGGLRRSTKSGSQSSSERG
jgi:hypothetical protein